MYSNILRLLIVVIVIVPIYEVAFSQDCPNPPDKVYLLRHAHKCENSSRFDVKISSTFGREMAEEHLVTKMQGEEVQISAIYTTDYPRTIQTADLLANSEKCRSGEICIRNVRRDEITKGHTEELIDSICGDQSGDTVVVVGHSDTLRNIISRLCRRTNTSGCSIANTSYCGFYELDFNQSSEIFTETTYCPYTDSELPRTAPCMTE